MKKSSNVYYYKSCFDLWTPRKAFRGPKDALDHTEDCQLQEP